MGLKKPWKIYYYVALEILTFNLKILSNNMVKRLLRIQKWSNAALKKPRLLRDSSNLFEEGG